MSQLVKFKIQTSILKHKDKIKTEFFREFSAFLKLNYKAKQDCSYQGKALNVTTAF